MIDTYDEVDNNYLDYSEEDLLFSLLLFTIDFY